MECYTYLRNIQDLLADGETPYERRFGEPFIGPIIPFGAMVEYHPISSKDQTRKNSGDDSKGDPLATDENVCAESKTLLENREDFGDEAHDAEGGPVVKPQLLSAHESSLDVSQVFSSSGVSERATPVGLREGYSLDDAVPDTVIGNAWSLPCLSDEEETALETLDRVCVWLPPSLSMSHSLLTTKAWSMVKACIGQTSERGLRVLTSWKSFGFLERFWSVALVRTAWSEEHLI